MSTKVEKHSAAPASVTESLLKEVERLTAHAAELQERLAHFEKRNKHGERGELLDEFAATTRGWFWQTDAMLRFTYLSPSVKDVMGVEPEWHYGKSRYEMGVPDSVTPEEWEAHLELIRNFEPYSEFVYQRKGPDGVRWLSTSGRPYFDEDGTFLGYVGTATDVTEEMEAKQTVDRLLAAIENHAEPFVLWDPTDRILVCNRRFREVNAAIPDAIARGTRYEDHLRAGIAAKLFPHAIGKEEEWLQMRMERHRNPTAPLEVRRADGKWVILTDYRLPDGCTLTISTDITARKRAEIALAQKTNILETALKTIPDGVQVLDKSLKLAAWNDMLFEVLDLDSEPILKSPDAGRALLEALAHRGEFGKGDIDELVASREAIAKARKPVNFESELTTGKWIECRGGPVRDGGYVLVYRDINDARRMTERLKELASVDELTRLTNRRHFMELAHTEFERARRYDRDLTFVMLDIDYFKAVNDEHGHSAGDAVLRAVAAACRESTRQSDRIGRLGGEEFAIIMPETDAKAAEQFAQRIRQHIARTVVPFNGVDIRVTASFGLCTTKQYHTSPADVLEAADEALYEAKRTGRNRVVDRAKMDRG